MNNEITLPVNTIAEEIAKRVARFAPSDKKLWDIQDCADYFGVSKAHFSDNLSNHHSFPEPLKLPSETGKRQHRRWYAAEVIQWAEKLR